MKDRHGNKLVWLQNSGPAPLEAARHFSQCEPVRQWRVLRALAASPATCRADSQGDADAAFDRVAYGVRHGQISMDYQPADAVTLDIPAGSDPVYLEAMVYWSVRMDCSMNVLCEAHARLGKSPSVRNCMAAVLHIEREEAADHAWAATARRDHGGQTAQPLFANTVPFRAH